MMMLEYMAVLPLNVALVLLAEFDQSDVRIALIVCLIGNCWVNLLLMTEIAPHASGPS